MLVCPLEGTYMGCLSLWRAPAHPAAAILGLERVEEGVGMHLWCRSPFRLVLCFKPGTQGAGGDTSPCVVSQFPSASMDSTRIPVPAPRLRASCLGIFSHTIHLFLSFPRSSLSSLSITNIEIKLLVFLALW